MKIRNVAILGHRAQAVKQTTVAHLLHKANQPSRFGSLVVLLLLLVGASSPAASITESIAIFAADCTTPKTAFNLGDMVCARVIGAPPGRRLHWSGPFGAVLRTASVVADSQADVFIVPSTAILQVGGQTVDNRGVWRVSSLDAETTLRASAFFMVHDPVQTTANLVVRKSVSAVDSDFTSGGKLATKLWVTNLGPDAAQQVVVTDTVPPHTTFVSLMQESGPLFACTTPPVGGSGITTCTAANLAQGARATFTVIYQITSTASDIVSTASIASETNQVAGDDNSSSVTALDTSLGSGVCTITCPADITVSLPLNSKASSMVVTYPELTATEFCTPTTLQSAPASGSVFPVGETTVTSTGTDAAGKPSTCNFVVRVRYNFKELSSLPLNVTTAGNAIPVKFSLSGDKGLKIFAADYPTSRQVSCETDTPPSDVPGIIGSRGSALSYDAAADQYSYVWQTERAWAGTCRQLVIRLRDGSEHVANFKFK